MIKVMPTALVAGALCCALLPSAWAQDGIESRDIAVVQKPLVELAPAEPTELKVTAKLDHANNMYRIGDSVAISVHTNMDAYITILDIGTSGAATVIFPNRSDKKNRVRANETLKIPTADATWKFQTNGPTGNEFIKVIASTSPKPVFRDGDTVGADIYASFKEKGEEAARDIAVVLKADHPKQWAQTTKVMHLRK